MTSGFKTDLGELLVMLKDELAIKTDTDPAYVAITLADNQFLPDATSDRYILITGFSGTMLNGPFDGGGAMWDGDPTGAMFDNSTFTIIMGNRLDTDVAGHDANRLTDASFGMLAEAQLVRRVLFNWWPVATRENGDQQAMLAEMPRVTSWVISTRKYTDAAGWARISLKVNITYIQGLDV